MLFDTLSVFDRVPWVTALYPPLSDASQKRGSKKTHASAKRR